MQLSPVSPPAGPRNPGASGSPSSVQTAAYLEVKLGEALPQWCCCLRSTSWEPRKGLEQDSGCPQVRTERGEGSREEPEPRSPHPLCWGWGSGKLQVLPSRGRPPPRGLP